MLATIVSRFIKPAASSILGERWNSTVADSTVECRKLFESAKKSVRIVAGELQHEVFNDDQVLATLEEASTRKENPVHVEIIYGPNPDPQSKRILALQKRTKGKVHIMQVPKRPNAHFILVDNNRVRIERFHGINEPIRRAYIIKDSMFLKGILADKFDDLKASSRKSKA